ncbi:MAG: type II toxin-antitoxin system Phd/YefM family antitoxin [Myxococcota bacterium]|nr:type II toxin-antitoxin system Phd/YefM family antitoxin [Myxococcota bacterium]
MKTTNETAVSAAEFKTRCLALLDRVAKTGRAVIVTKRGRPVARVVPLEEAGPPSLRGSIVHQDDIVFPVGAAWETDG